MQQQASMILDGLFSDVEQAQKALMAITKFATRHSMKVRQAAHHEDMRGGYGHVVVPDGRSVNSFADNRKSPVPVQENDIDDDINEGPEFEQEQQDQRDRDTAQAEQEKTGEASVDPLQ